MEIEIHADGINACNSTAVSIDGKPLLDVSCITVKIAAGLPTQITIDGYIYDNERNPQIKADFTRGRQIAQYRWRLHSSILTLHGAVATSIDLSSGWGLLAEKPKGA